MEQRKSWSSFDDDVSTSQGPFSFGLGGDGLGGRGRRGTRVGFGAGGAGAVLCASMAYSLLDDFIRSDQHRR